MRPPLCVLLCVLVVMCEATDESYEKRPLNFATVIPFMNFNLREIKRKMASAINDIPKRRPPFEFLNYYEWPYQEPTRMHAEPSPTFILDAVCNTFLKRNVTAILYLSNTELYGATTASAQYFLQLAGYLGIPVICWNADNSGLEQKMSTNINLQMAPSIRDQSAAMLSILKRYKWHQFGIVTSLIAGHNDFIDAVRDLIQDLQSSFRYTLLEAVVLDTNDPDQMRRQLSKLAETETRIVLLYSTREEAPWIIGVAMELELTGKDFVWIGTHSVVGNTEDAYAGLTPGMLGINFNTTFDAMMVQLDKAIKVLAHGIELFVNDPRNINVTLQPNLSCLGHGESRWSKGEVLYNFLRNVSFLFDSERIEFNYDGTLKNAELQVRNLNNDMKWDKIGKWTADGLDIKDIVWPGNAHTPPLGIPEKFHLKVAFLEEPAFVNLAPVDPVTQQCVNRGVFCRTGHRENDLQGSINVNSTSKNSSIYQCCSGYSVDLLAKYANDLGFTFDMVRVEDGYWGTEINGKWNGLVASLLHRKADMVMTAFKVNSYRESVIDFTLPFMETGIAIVVAKRTGIISPKAFLEPFDTVSWLCILLIGIQVAAFAIFLFEWLSPTGYGMKIQPPRDHRFSLFRTYWLVWAILFGAAVNVDCPRGYTARYMANVWAMFAVVFLAIYTANLAAFMITTEEYYDLTGIDDPRLSNPFSMKPPFRFGTVPFSNSEAIVQRNQPQIYHYMKHYNKSTVLEGITAVKRGELDAFIYDATVLEYLVGQDDDCKLLTVGSWYARTGYGIGFPKFSKYLNLFNKQMMIYRENGDLERLRRFWMTGGCKPGKKERTASKPLSLEQFMSAFLLLACGFLLAGFLVLVEHIYFKYMHEHLAKTDTGGCCALISLNMGKSLTFRGAVYEAQDKIMQHRCKDPLCDIHLWKVKYELDLARLRISQLEKQLDKKHSSSNAIQYGGTSPGILRARDMTKNHVTTNEPQGLKYRDGHLYKTVATELPKQDTVL